MKQMIQELIAGDYLKTPAIIDAFQKIDRRDFVPDGLKEQSYLNIPLPIGYGQTISQPLTVAFMLEILQPEKGNRILEVGSGSGWQTALLSHIISGGTGKVFAVEIVPELMEFGRKNTSKYNFVKNKIAEFHHFNAINGMPEEAPFDRIISAASGQGIPKAWKEQLKEGGKIVAPVKESIRLLIKKSSPTGGFEEKNYPGFVFVPLVGN